MHHRRDKAPSRIVHLVITPVIILVIISVVALGLSAASSVYIDPVQGQEFWALVGIALAPLLILAVAIWLAQRERYASRRSYRRAK
jgi:hypothetical protein